MDYAAVVSKGFSFVLGLAIGTGALCAVAALHL
jgi:hypothetical protein